MLTADGSALVAGQRLPAEAVVGVVAVRGFYFDGTAMRPGDQVSVPYRLAKELCALGKAKWADPPASPEPARPFLALSGALSVTPDTKKTPARKKGSYE